MSRLREGQRSGEAVLHSEQNTQQHIPALIHPCNRVAAANSFVLEHPVSQAAAPERLPRLLPPRQAHLRGSGAEPPEGLAAELERTDAALAACSTAPDAPVVVYISKMVAVPTIALPR